MICPHDEYLVRVAKSKHPSHAAQFPDVRRRMERVRRDQVGEDPAECVVATEDVNGVEAESASDEYQPAGDRHAKNRAKAASVPADNEDRFHHTMNPLSFSPGPAAGASSS